MLVLLVLLLLHTVHLTTTLHLLLVLRLHLHLRIRRESIRVGRYAETLLWVEPREERFPLWPVKHSSRKPLQQTAVRNLELLQCARSWRHVKDIQNSHI